MLCLSLKESGRDHRLVSSVSVVQKLLGRILRDSIYLPLEV